MLIWALLPYATNTECDSHRTQSATPSLRTGYAVLVGSFVFLLVGLYALLFSAFVPDTGFQVRGATIVHLLLEPDGVVWFVQVLDALARDTHYKYFPILLIPTTAYFVIANWVGWQYYRNS